MEHVAPLAYLIYNRPWGIGFTNLCLLTSDVPVQIINAQDDEDQLKAASFWDIYLPLDPHRFLYLPGYTHRSDRELMRDHKINLPGGLAMPLNDLMVEYSYRHIFFSPEHDPRDRMDRQLILDSAARRELQRPSETLMSYAPLHPRFGIERRWLHKHTWDEPESRSQNLPRGDDQDLLKHVEFLSREIDAAKKQYESH